ncbi:hypothetical protein [Aestuariivirga sp.]|uniref:hypothetical protein n=1 Tax=Aestuariivirga sp. TaxID=2650926 RepID=UPI0039E4037D
MSLLDPLLDLFRGKAVTIPPMDGALRPNTMLDEAEVVVAAIEPDNLAVLKGKLIYSSGHEVRQVSPHKVLATLPSPVTALAVSSDDVLALGLEDGTLKIGEKTVAGFNCITALTFHEGALYVCNGSADFAPSQWTSDLMHRNRSGSVWRVDPATGSRTQLASGLNYAYGITVDTRNQRLVVSESWAHRLVAVPLSGGRPAEVLSRLPAYPARLTATHTGYLLALFAPLNRLVEFVLQEPQYRADMMREIDSRFWIAPTLSPAHSFLEPLQNGGVRSMGVHKPWSPSRSYGLVASLDHDFQPETSFHSRANGRFHGVTSAILFDGRVVAASKGGNHIIGIATGGAA